MVAWGALLAATLGAQTNDWTIVPGSRVGPITASTVREDLTRLFPRQSNVGHEHIEKGRKGLPIKKSSLWRAQVPLLIVSFRRCDRAANPRLHLSGAGQRLIQRLF